MAVVQSIANLLLKPLVGDIAEHVVAVLTDHWTDHGERLVKALRTANERAWKSFEVALAGDSWWQQIKGLLARKEDQAFSLQVRAFLDGLPMPDLADKTRFREQCLRELQQARRNQDLTKGELTAAALRAQARPLVKAQPQAVLDAQWQALRDVVADLRQAGHKNLAWLVEQPPPSGPPLLTLAVQFFFQRAVESDSGLFQGLTYTTLGELTASQRVGFQSLNAALSQQGQRLEGMLDELGRKMDQLQRDIEELKRLVQQAIQHNQLSQQELRPRDSLSIRSDGERQLVKKLVAQYRNLPPERQQQLPELLGDLARLQVAAGEFEAARKHFEEVARRAADVRLRATAFFNAYRAALEQQAWDAALEHLNRAVELDEARLAPFPVSRYRLLRILGAGGFGVAFLCEHRHMKVPVVVKAMLQDDLDRTIETVFHEARLLIQLDDPGFVRAWDCGYADSAGMSRPYLVMDFFDGLSLEEHVKRFGCLPPADAKAVLRPIAQALLSAHAGKILHRDVKPANVLLRRTETGWRVKLIDFGLALKQSALQAGADDTARLGRTLSGHGIAGTLDYAAPEQLGKLPGVPLGPHCDVYGFGKTAYFALLGTPDPDDRQKGTLPLAWRKFLRECVAHPQTRLPDFTPVLKLLNKIKPRKAPKQAGKAKLPPSATVPSVPRAYSMACPHCRKELRLGAEHMGKTARCPYCSGVFRLPAVGGVGIGE